ncbi:hypothetical protein QTP70_001636 [Hemibagrus guttatus]|uniref:ribonuclease H n=1 Tax=Hemibagrus guttatus TaxID=175788 RepID=A0AAE0RA13_9TELE|nr:hypothetical protein QTP70_001636 [Hemibagrus guttatus]
MAEFNSEMPNADSIIHRAPVEIGLLLVEDVEERGECADRERRGKVGCELEEKERFWSELDEVMESIPTGERVAIGADFNGHVGEGNRGDEEKREEHRVTYKSGGRRTQVDYILCRRGNLKEISDCKVVVGESVARQHKMVVCRMTLMVCKKKRSKIEIEKKTKWWKLKKEECCEEFRFKLRQALGGQVVLPDNWETTAEVIRDDIPVEVWKCLGEAAVEFLSSLFNRVLESERMPEEWRRSVLVPIFKNKGDVQSCSNYRGMKLMSHTMKLWERVVEARLRKVVEICEQQYGFMPRKSTTGAIFALRILMEKYRDGQRELHCVFVDLEKAYDRVPREELWYCMRKSGVAEKYVRVVQDMYERSRTVVRCAVGQTEEFKVEVGLHQGLALSPFLFAMVMDQLSEKVRQESPWTMMFADDMVICSESREQVEENLERWRFALERRGMKVSCSKTEYMCVNEREGSGTVRLQGEEVKKVQEFKYLGSTVQSNRECGKEIEMSESGSSIRVWDWSSPECRARMDEIFFRQHDYIQAESIEHKEFWAFFERFQRFKAKREMVGSKPSKSVAELRMNRASGTLNLGLPKEYDARYRINIFVNTKDVDDRFGSLHGRRHRDYTTDPPSQEVRDCRIGLLHFLDFTQKQGFCKLVKLQREQKSLPIFHYRDRIVELVQAHPVVVVAGDTGCGKSTQVPQYLLGSGFNHIACTQPRRIACISLAKRVSFESLNQYGSKS